MPGSTLEVRAHLVEFSRALARAMVESPWYSPSHPDARKSVDQVWQAHRKLVEGQWGCHEVHLLVSGPDGHADGLMAGVEAEPVLLSVLLHGTMGEHLHQQILELMAREHILSLGFRRTMTRSDLEHFLVEVAQRIMAARRAKDANAGTEGPRPSPAPLREALLALDVNHITVLHGTDLLDVTPADTPWLVRVNISRMQLELARGSHLTDPQQREALLRRVVTEGFLSLGASWIRHAFLVAAANETVPGESSPLSTVVVRHIPESVRTSLAWELIGAMDDPLEPQSSQRRSEALLKTLSSGIQVEAGPASADLLMLLHRRGVVTFEELPDSLKDRLRVRGWTDQFLDDPDAYLARLHVLHEPDALRDYLTAVRFIYRELLARNRHAEALQALEALLGLAGDPDEPEDRREMARAALDWLRRVDVAPTLAEAARTEDQEQRRTILAILKSLGPQMLFPLLTLLGHVRAPSARKDVCDAIRDMGPAVVPVLVEELLRITHPWFLHRNILMMLSELHANDAAREVRRMLEHPHIRVREQAATTLVAIIGAQAEPDLVKCLADGDRDLQLRVLPLLTEIGSGDPLLVAFLRSHVAALAGRDDTDESLVSQCLTSITELAGRWSEADRKTIETALLDILDPPLSRALIRRAQGYRLLPRVREQAVRALCAAASSRARSALERLARDSMLGIRQAATARLSTLDS